MYIIKPAEQFRLFTNSNTNIPLQSVKVKSAFENLFCETTITQTYLNSETQPIEAVYTFPLPVKAVLLDLRVTIGKKELRGLIVEKQSAEEQYEEAIVKGNTSIMLEQLQPGMYTMNVGNIQAAEEISIVIVFAEIYTWQGKSLRYFLPTTIAPRYGSPEEAGLEPHQLPESDILSENRFQLEISFTGVLAEAEFESPSHNISVSRSGPVKVVRLAAGKACMDRDFVLNIQSSQKNHDSIIIEHDPIAGYVALASFTPQLPAPEKVPAKSIKIVVDCSGSMTGDSITQARQAISDILNLLRPEDFFNLITFGSTCKALFKKQVQADKKNVTKARRYLRGIDADMGGTEMQKALESAIALTGPPIPQEVLLITDGEVWESDKIIRTVNESGHRFFTVGVGSSVSEQLVRELAAESEGACELVAPREQMADKIVRHYQRIYLAKADKVEIEWPINPRKKIPQNIKAVYDGDTLHGFALFSELPQGPVTLKMTLADGKTFTQTVIIDNRENPVAKRKTPGPITRMAIHHSLKEMAEDAAANPAVAYQLLSPWTNFLVVDEQTDRGETGELPRLRKVPQTLAAGWGGTSSIIFESAPDIYDIPCFHRSSPPAEAGAAISFCRRPKPEAADEIRPQTTPAEFIERCNQRHAQRFCRNLQLKNFEDLLACGLPDKIQVAIDETSLKFNPDLAVETIVLAFLLGLSRSSVGQLFAAKTLKALNLAASRQPAAKKLAELYKNMLAGIGDDEWGPDFA